MTKALAAALGDDPWLCDLALRILTWVGVPATAGVALWPLDEWTRARAERTGDLRGSTPVVVANEVERVLTVLRRRPDWFAKHVERPFGLKAIPVAPPPGDGPAEPRPLIPTDPAEVDEARLGEIAADALVAVKAALQEDRDPAEAVSQVLSSIFLGGSGVEELDRPPGSGAVQEERLAALLSDPNTLEKIIDKVLQIAREAT